jgi:L-ascorbate 6-phosphate lactonase
MDAVRRHVVPDRSLVLWWLGQAGFLVKSPGGTVVVIDPYLSNSCKPIGDQHGFDMDRLVPPPLVAAELVGVHLYAVTHSHQDHLDPETVGDYRAAGGHGPYLAPAEAADKLRSLGVPAEQIEMTWPNKVFATGDVRLRAAFAIPFSGDDLTHVGYLVSCENGPTFYFTGDTDYHDLLGESVAAHHPDVMVTVINGAFRNLGPAEAARLARRIDPRVVIPCHYDLFPDNTQPPQMLRTNLQILGIGDRYRRLAPGEPLTFGKSGEAHTL